MECSGLKCLVALLGSLGAQEYGRAFGKRRRQAESLPWKSLCRLRRQPRLGLLTCVRHRDALADSSEVIP